MSTPASSSWIWSRQRRNAERLVRSLSRTFSAYLTLKAAKNSTKPTSNQRCCGNANRGDSDTASMTRLPCGARHDQRPECSSGRCYRQEQWAVGSGQWAVGSGRQAAKIDKVEKRSPQV